MTLRSPSLRFKDKNATLQMYGTAPGSEVYPKDNNLCPYFAAADTKLVYVNHLPSLAVGTTLTIKINGSVVGTSVVRNTDGLYIYEFNPPYGIFTLTTVLPGLSEISQTFSAKNLLIFSTVSGQEYESAREQALAVIGGANAKNYVDGGAFLRICTDSQLSNNFSSHIGFDRPTDWDYETYVGAIGGDIEDGIEGTTGSLAAAVVTIGSVFSGISITNLLSGELLWYRGRSISAASGGFRGSTTSLITYPSKYPGILTWGASSDSTLYVLFKISAASSQFGNYYIGVDSNGKLAIVKKAILDNTIKSGIAYNFYRMYEVVVSSAGAVSIVTDFRNLTTKIQKQGAMSAKQAGASVDSVKDVIESVTGYRPTDTDMRYLQLSYRTRPTGIRHGVAADISVQEVSAGGALTPVAGYAAAYMVNITSSSPRGAYAWGREIGYSTDFPKITAQYGGTWDAAGLNAVPVAADACFTYGVPNAANPTHIAFVVKAPTADYDLLAGMNYDGRADIWLASARDTSGYWPISSFTTNFAAERLEVDELLAPCPYAYLARIVNVMDNSGPSLSVDIDPADNIYNGGFPQSLAIDDSLYTIPDSLIALGYNPSQMNAGVHYTNNHIIDIIHDGFSILADVITKTADDGEDKLVYSWISPFAPAVAGIWEVIQEQFTGLSSFTLSETPTTNSVEVYLNGVYLSEGTDYTVSGAAVTIITSVAPTDVLDVVYSIHAPIHYKETFSTSPATLSQPLVYVYGTKVMLNGTRLSYEAGDYTVSGNTLTINVAMSSGDTIDIMYVTGPTVNCPEIVSIDRALVPITGVINATHRFLSGSAVLYINGIAQAPASITEDPGGLFVTLSPSIMAGTVSGDIIMVTTRRLLGYNVNVWQVLPNGTTVTYYQGTDFLVNYTKGRIEWIAGRPQPVAGTAYYANYSYFPKDILIDLLRLVKPATGIITQMYNTTDGIQFNPYDRFAWPFKLPQDDLVF